VFISLHRYHEAADCLGRSHAPMEPHSEDWWWGRARKSQVLERGSPGRVLPRNGARDVSLAL